MEEDSSNTDSSSELSKGEVDGKEPFDAETRRKLKNAVKRRKKRAKKRVQRQEILDIKESQNQVRREYYQNQVLAKTSVNLYSRLTPAKISLESLASINDISLGKIFEVIKEMTLIKDSLRNEKNANAIQKSRIEALDSVESISTNAK